MSDAKGPVTAIIQQLGSKLPKLTRRQTGWLLAGTLTCGTTAYLTPQLIHTEPVAAAPAPSVAFGDISTIGQTGHVIPVVAQDNAHVNISIGIAEAKEALPDPNEFDYLITAKTDKVLTELARAEESMDAVIQSNRDRPTDKDAEAFCLASRKAFFALSVLHERNYAQISELADDLLMRYEFSEALLQQCNCKLCGHMLDSVHRRHRYLVALSRYGEDFASPEHFRELAAEP